MPVRFEGPDGTEELIPAPLVNIRKSYAKDAGGTTLRPEYTITLNGAIVNVGSTKSSPGASGYDYGDMEGILSEQKRIRNLFSNEGGRLEIESPDGGGANTIDAYCFVNSINFQESTWTVRNDYSVELLAYNLFPTDETVDNIINPTENWEISEQPNNTYVIVHNISAQGTKVYDATGVNDPLTTAKTWVRERSFVISNGTLSSVSGNSFVPTDLNAIVSGPYYWNMNKVETAGGREFSWQLTETMVYYPSGSAREEYNIVVNYDPTTPSRATIVTDGIITGYADSDLDFNTKYSNALSYWSSSVLPNLYTRVYAARPSGFSVSVFPERQVTHNKTEGTVSYTYTYQALSGSLIPNASQEEISIIDSAATDVFAQIQVPGRSDGPVVQNMSTKTLPERTVNITAVIPGNSYSSLSNLLTSYLSKPATSDIVNALKPNDGYYFVTQDTEDWNPIRGAYTRTTSWTIQPEGDTINGTPSGIQRNKS